jgi:hypothetical protein
VTNDQLTAVLAERIMRWRVAPERFPKADRKWTPRWHFQPLRRMDHALQLLEKAGGRYTFTRKAGGAFTADVFVGDRAGSASGKSEAATLTVALARALGIEPDLPEVSE